MCYLSLSSVFEYISVSLKVKLQYECLPYDDSRAEHNQAILLLQRDMILCQCIVATARLAKVKS